MIRGVRKWGIIVCSVLVATSVATSVSFAAPPDQAATPTPTSTTEIYYATITPIPTTSVFTLTPSPTLRSIPEGQGLAQVPVLTVRAGPSREWYPIGSLAYNEPVIPIGRDETIWIAIEWNNGTEIGWVSSLLVRWDPSLDLQALPIIEVTTFVTPIGVNTLTPTVLPTITSTPSNTATLPPTSTLAPVTATATEVPASPTAEEVAAIPEIDATEEISSNTDPEPPTEEPESQLRFNAKTILYGSLGVIGLGLVLYGGRFVMGLRDRDRYADGFVLEECPVCQTGTLYLEEVSSRTAGLTRVKRSVRCDTCRSVLRQIRPGSWRYYIDPMINPTLAKEYNARQFSDATLLAFAEKAYDYQPEFPVSEAEEFPTPEEVIAELEAKYEAAILDEVVGIIEEEEAALDLSEDDLEIPEGDDLYMDLLNDDEE